MTSLEIKEADLNIGPHQIAVITGGSSGIGHATAELLLFRGVRVHVLDIVEPDAFKDGIDLSLFSFWRCDVSHWESLQITLRSIGRIDMLFANAGLPEPPSFFDEEFEGGDDQWMKEPSSRVMDVNLKGVLYTVKLGWHIMRKQERGGSIVITASGTAYFPWQSIALYSSIKIALIGLVRSLRSLTIRDNVTINAVAPGMTITRALPRELAQPIIDRSGPASSAHTVAVALVHSAVASQHARVEAYGTDVGENDASWQRWNGRVILVLGHRYTEVEERYAQLREQWCGVENARLYALQQAATDFREPEALMREPGALCASGSNGGILKGPQPGPITVEVSGGPSTILQ